MTTAQTEAQRLRGPVLTPYETWVGRQNVPVVEGYGVRDLSQPSMSQWERLGCQAYFVLLRGWGLPSTDSPAQVRRAHRCPRT